MDDEQPSYSSFGGRCKARRPQGHGFDAFPVFKGAGRDLVGAGRDLIFTNDSVQPTENELGLGTTSIYDSLDCFGGKRKRKSKANKPGSAAVHCRQALKKLIGERFNNPEERKRIYNGVLASLSREGTRQLTIRSEKDLREILTTYCTQLRKKKMI